MLIENIDRARTPTTLGGELFHEVCNRRRGHEASAVLVQRRKRLTEELTVHL